MKPANDEARAGNILVKYSNVFEMMGKYFVKLANDGAKTGTISVKHSNIFVKSSDTSKIVPRGIEKIANKNRFSYRLIGAKVMGINNKVRV